LNRSHLKCNYIGKNLSGMFLSERKTLCKLIALAISTLVSTSVWPVMAVSDKTVPPLPKMAIEYNQEFIHGSGVDVSKFIRGNHVSSGDYHVQVMVNGERQGEYLLKFRLPNDQASAEPCFSYRQLLQMGIRLDALSSMDENKLNAQECRFIFQWIEQAHTVYNSGDLELSIQVPQYNVIKRPRGYIDPLLWDAGKTVAFVDYNSSLYSSFYDGRSQDAVSKNYYGNLGLMLGFNIGEWRFRKRTNLSWSSQGTSTQNLLGYAATDIIGLKSQLVLGETNTQGELFDSYGLRGVMLSSDDRMLPEAVRNYAPIIRGIAHTNAKVTVTQRGQTVYETVVPPGAFELTDVGTMGYGGDLLLTITEADGRQRSQSVPFSAPPMLLHQGVSRFSFSAGQLYDPFIAKSPYIAQGIYRYGMGNLWTLYGGSQIGENYYSLALGNAFNTPIGGVSVDVTHAHTQLKDGRTSSGNSFKVDFSKYVDSTDTNFVLAAYRYSSQGFYTFREASLARYGSKNSGVNNDIDISNYRTRHRFSANVSQRLSDNMTLNFDGSLYDYWGGEQTSRTYGVTFNHMLANYSYAVTAMRTRDQNGRDENNYLLSISIPLGNPTKKPLFSSLYSTMGTGYNGQRLQVSANGSQGERNQWTYGVGVSTANQHYATTQQAVTGNINYQSPFGQWGMTASADRRSSRQLSLSANGSLVAHKGGITAGPRLGDAPFAIVGAQGAQGAALFNGQGAKIDNAGYAILPSLTPYRENMVAIDYKGLPDTVDVLENQKVTVPRTGAAIAVDMKTIIGTPWIVIARDNKHSFLPIGTDLLDEQGSSQGVVGQRGMAFVRGWQPLQQSLYAQVKGTRLVCRAKSAVSRRAKKQEANQQISQVEVVCSRG
jgi:outer membrane usher protein